MAELARNLVQTSDRTLAAIATQAPAMAITCPGCSASTSAIHPASSVPMPLRDLPSADRKLTFTRDHRLKRLCHDAQR